MLGRLIGYAIGAYVARVVIRDVTRNVQHLRVQRARVRAATGDAADAASFAEDDIEAQLEQLREAGAPDHELEAARTILLEKQKHRQRTM